MEPTPTVTEHVQSLQATPPPQCVDNYTSQRAGRYRNESTPPMPSNNRDLHRLVHQVYLNGSRSPQLMNLVYAMRHAVPLRIAITSAEYIRRIWEVSLSPAADQREDESVEPASGLLALQSQQRLTNYIANLIHRLSPSIVTIFSAVYYIGRLRRLYPKAHGEAGCGHRLITIALLIAHRYLECHSPPNESFYCHWSQHSGGIFSPADLFRMELEFVAFLRFNLYTPYDDFEYFVERVYNQEGGQTVPRSLDIPTLARPVGVDIDRDAAVPDATNLVL